VRKSDINETIITFIFIINIYYIIISTLFITNEMNYFLSTFALFSSSVIGNFELRPAY
jgi:hypothetical protein